jgi:D-3-phosphoglycerate dehydrogenase
VNNTVTTPITEVKTSYPKNRINVLLLENINPEAVRLMKEEGYNVETHPTALDEDELAERIRDVSILGIRSKTQLTEKALENAKRLIAVGAFCIGTDQIDLSACQKKGVAVFNAPYSNTRSVVELAIAEIIMLMRNLPDKLPLMHQGVWDKSAKSSYEIRNKTLGIIGYGSIGTQLSVLAEALGMRVYYFDLAEKLSIGNATRCHSLKELLQISDVISIHVDGRSTNERFIGAAEFEMMKPGAIFVNLSRGNIIDVEALRANILSGKIRGAAVDVFPEEPKGNANEFVSPLRGLPNTILTPHIGGSTTEAQVNIGTFVPTMIKDYINTGSTTTSVNFPAMQLPKLENAHRLIHIHRNVAGVLANINSVLAKHKINIVGQYLKTNEQIGYVITDIDKEYSDDVRKDLKSIEHTIRFRVLY